MSQLFASWNTFSNDIAERYLKTFGHPSIGSKSIVSHILKSISSPSSCLSVADLGCGNGQLLEYFLEHDLHLDYTGIDISQPLLDVAVKKNPAATFIHGDVHDISVYTPKNYDAIIYSHVLEMLESPHQSLANSSKLTETIIIRFFEPPDHQYDTVELCEMDLGIRPVPYIRRRMSRDYYHMILSHIGCVKVDVYLDESRDQVHVLTLPK